MHILSWSAACETTSRRCPKMSSSSVDRCWRIFFSGAPWETIKEEVLCVSDVNSSILAFMPMVTEAKAEMDSVDFLPVPMVDFSTSVALAPFSARRSATEDRTHVLMVVDGEFCGGEIMKGKIAFNFCFPRKFEVLNLQKISHKIYGFV